MHVLEFQIKILMIIKNGKIPMKCCQKSPRICIRKTMPRTTQDNKNEMQYDGIKNILDFK